MKTTKRSRKLFQPVLATLAIAIICGISAPLAQAGYIVTLQQVGPDVVATGSGAIDLTGLIFNGRFPVFPGINPSQGFIETGPTGSGSVLGGFTGPPIFGSGGARSTSTDSGDIVGIIPRNNLLIVPDDYISDSPLSSSATWDSATLASLDVTPGTYVWMWGTGVNQNFTLQIPAVGVPDSGSAFALLFLSLGALFGASRFRSLRLA